MASLLPSTADNFRQLGYWDQFYSRRSVPFEWYGEYKDIEHALHRYLRPKDKILQIGCGNSTFAEELYDNGIQDITSIDVVASVISAQVQKASVSGRGKLTYEVMDATKLISPSSSFSAVLDKGTLDALLPLDRSQDDVGGADVVAMFDEVYRVLTVLGRYIVVSLAQEHVVTKWLEYFQRRNCLIRIHVVPKSNDEEFALPVFLLVITKLRDEAGDSKAQSLEIAETSSSNSLAVQKLPSAEDITSKVKDIQTYCLLCKHLRERRLDGEIALSLSLSQPSDKERERTFDVRILDVDLKKPAGPYAVFVTPIGREQEYHFGDKEGRIELAQQVNYSRLAVLRLNSYTHGYENVDQIRNDLGTRILDFAPGLCHRRNFQVPFLSATSDLSGTVETVFEKTSEVNGPLAVFDVWANETTGHRRLVFMKHQGMVQSEAAIEKKKAPGKKRTKVFSVVVNAENLTCAHHRIFVSRVEDWFNKTPDRTLCIAILGLGGGLLATFAAEHRLVKEVAAVELDPLVHEVAKQCFALSEKVAVHIGCAAEAVSRWSREKRTFNCTMIDVAGASYESGIDAPVPALLTEDFVQNLAVCTANGGVVLVNVVARRTEKFETVKKVYSSAFEVVEVVSIPDEVNRIMVLKPRR